MKNPEIDLVYFEGCPHVEEARAALRDLLPGESWTERDLTSAETPDRFRRYGSPTVLVDGRDVTGAGAGDPAGATSCRTDGAPSRDVIREALAREG